MAFASSLSSCDWVRGRTWPVGKLAVVLVPSQTGALQFELVRVGDAFGEVARNPD